MSDDTKIEFDRLMEQAKQKLDEIKIIDKQRETLKSELSTILKSLRPLAPKDMKSSFQYKGLWYSIKCRDGKFFMIDWPLGKKPGEWRVKKQKSGDENGEEQED